VLPEHLPPAAREAAARAAVGPAEPTAAAGPDAPAVKTLEEVEIESIRRALERTGGNRTKAAQLLGITRRGLIYKLKRLGI
jgi:DNA-binding NtrC family response regulator